MNKKKLYAAIAPFPIKQSDKERFVNTITEMSSNGGGGVEYEYYSFYDFINAIPTLPQEEFTKLYNDYVGFISLITHFNTIPIIVIPDINHKSFFIETSALYYLSIAGKDSIPPIMYFKIEKQNIRIMPDLYYNESSREVRYKGDIISNKNTFKEQFIEIINNKYGEGVIDIDFINNYMTTITKEEYESLIGQEVPD